MITTDDNDENSCDNAGDDADDDDADNGDCSCVTWKRALCFKLGLIQRPKKRRATMPRAERCKSPKLLMDHVEAPAKAFHNASVGMLKIVPAILLRHDS